MHYGRSGVLGRYASGVLSADATGFVYLYADLGFVCFLKGLLLENIVVLGQFCAELITSCLYPYTKFSTPVTMKMSNRKFHQRALTFW